MNESGFVILQHSAFSLAFLLAAPKESVYTWARLRVAVESLVRADNDGRILASHHQATIIH